MNRNQKIAVGCGGLGCLGLIVLGIAGAVVYIYMPNSTGRTYNFNANPNVNSNRNSNTNANESTNSSNGTVSQMSDGDKHKLFHAVGMTRDQELMKRVVRKLGLTSANDIPTDEYAEFVKDHIGWAIQNTAFISSINTPEKAKAYVDAHFEN